MQIKKLSFALPAMLLAIFFTFCTKEPVVPVNAPSLPAGGTVSSRANCKVNVSFAPSVTINVCGMDPAGAICGNVGANILRGNAALVGPNASDTYGVNVPAGGVAHLILSGNPAVTAVQVTVTSSSGSTKTFWVGGGFPNVVVTIDDQCNVS